MKCGKPTPFVPPPEASKLHVSQVCWPIRMLLVLCMLLVAELKNRLQVLLCCRRAAESSACPAHPPLALPPSRQHLFCCSVNLLPLGLTGIAPPRRRHA